ncbi:MAG: ATP-binding protein [Cyanobacteria bacterium J06638_28]
MKRLHIDSRLEDLTLHCFTVNSDCLGQSVYQTFDDNPLLPGVVLADGKTFLGMISRRRFLEAMSRAYGRELFLRRSVSTLYEFVSIEVLQMSGDTPITVAAQQAIARPSELLYEPIVVQCSGSKQAHCLLDIHSVLQAQSTIHQLTTEMLREKTRAEIMQTEKMASLGKMMAGVAHEIRNPVNFIWGNLKYISDYTDDLATLIKAFDTEVQKPSKSLKKLKKKIDVEFVLEDLPKILQSIETGTDRLRNLVTGLRTFSRLDEVKRYPTDLHQSVDGTLVILNNRIKEGITIQKEYGELPIIPCYTGQIGQVFMNIISNAIDALLEYNATLPAAISVTSDGVPVMAERSWEPFITIITQLRDRLPDDVQPKEGQAVDQWISIRIQDNGPGIPIDIQAKIFDDFFTTKPVGDGTGLGLPIAKQIVTEKHQGHLILRSPCLSVNEPELAKGTEFEVLLPVTVEAQELAASNTEPPSQDPSAVDNQDPVVTQTHHDRPYPLGVGL